MRSSCIWCHVISNLSTQVINKPPVRSPIQVLGLLDTRSLHVCVDSLESREIFSENTGGSNC